MSRRELPISVLPQDEAGRLTHEAVQEKVQRRLPHLQATDRVVLLPRQDVSGGEVSGAVLPEHQAEAAAAADAAATPERRDDEAANGPDERGQDEPEQLRRRERSSEEHRKLDSGHHAADDAVVDAAFDATGCNADASRPASPHQAARADPGRSVDATTTTRDADARAGSARDERRRNDEQPRRKAWIATDARSSRGSSESPGRSSETVEPTTRSGSRLRRQEPSDDDVSSAADGQHAHGPAGASHDGRTAAAVATAAAATTAAAEISQPDATTQSNAAAANANGCSGSGTAAATATAATAWPASTARPARTAPAA